VFIQIKKNQDVLNLFRSNKVIDISLEIINNAKFINKLK